VASKALLLDKDPFNNPDYNEIQFIPVKAKQPISHFFKRKKEKSAIKHDP
jgi:hypothetical protein